MEDVQVELHHQAPAYQRCDLPIISRPLTRPSAQFLAWMLGSAQVKTNSRWGHRTVLQCPILQSARSIYKHFSLRS